MLQWAFEPADRDHLCAHAARGGQLEVLRWHDYLLDVWTCALAAQGGHLDVMKWLREHNCPWDADTIQQATAAGHDVVLQWALDNDCPS